MSDAASSKKVWRAHIAALFRLPGMAPPASRPELDSALCKRLAEILAECVNPGDGGTMLAFAALPDEPDLTPLYRQWLAGGGRLGLPVWRGGNGMTFREVREWNADLVSGRGGILEPSARCSEMACPTAGAILVPGRAFSERCDRLGRGMGCYDAMLSATAASVVRIGVCYDFQVFPALPAEPHDVRFDMVATPGRLVTYCNREDNEPI